MRHTGSAVASGVRRGIRLALLAVWAVGVRRRNAGAVVNALAAGGATFLPSAIERRSAVEFRPWQRLYVDAAMLAHAVGMLGPYDEVWWWDRVTHTLSSSLVAGAVYVRSRRRDRPACTRVLAVIVCAGLLWELLEYAVHGVAERLDVEPVLVPYSARDSLLDLCFNLVGALLVLAFGDPLLRNLVRRRDRSD